MDALVVNTFTNVWSRYLLLLHTRPLLTKCFTSLVGFVAGDAIAQCTTQPPPGPGHHRRRFYDVLRTLRLAIYGFCVGGPTAHYFYMGLDKVIVPSDPTSALAVMTKMTIDQCLWSPIGLVLFYIVIKTLEGRPGEIMETMRMKYVPTLRAGYMIWPLAHVINFWIIPSEQRVLYINAVSVAWTVILCRIANSIQRGGSFKGKLEQTDMTAAGVQV
ncbi:hypothetical protein WJX72_011189 [[Myrmecia] bisecta]|uniref:Peroxisomal membrane protein 2 n=1 Tax=[Myrmecia] bisecta TaxID=41462 RepID=A0AAW1PI35_9CHLO